MSTPSSVRRRRRWPLGLAALLGFLLIGSVVTAVLNARRLVGSVPGNAAILGLAVSPAGFLIGTSEGVLKSPDGIRWQRVDGFSGESLVAASGDTVAVVSGGKLSTSRDFSSFTPAEAQLDRPTALTVDREGRIWVAQPAAVVNVGATAPAPEIPLDGGPRQVLALGVQPPSDGSSVTVLAGGLSDGLWSFQPASGWRQILGTPTRAILVDPQDPQRYFLATAGGVLTASRTAPEFTGLRLPVEALAESGGTYYAITEDRLIYESTDGQTWEVRLPEA